MPNGKLKWWLYVVLTILLVVFMSCGTPGYKKYILREGGAHFSFEYPESYEKVSVDVDSRYASVRFALSQLEDRDDDSLLRVIVFQTSVFDRPDNAKAALEENISFLSNTYTDYQVLERNEIYIDGILAELMVCSYTLVEIPEDETDWERPCPLLRREVFFDYDGRVWNITIFSSEGRAEADEAVWERLLETFTILD